MTVRRAATESDEGGMVTLWGFMLMIVLLGFTGLVVDIWHVWEAKRDIQAVADSAALAGAGAVDEPWFRDTDIVRLNPNLARTYGNAAIDAQDDLPVLSRRLVAANFSFIDVTLETEVDLTLMRLFTASSSIDVEARARGVPLRSTPCDNQEPACAATPTTVPTP